MGTGLKLSDRLSTTVAAEERKSRNQLEKICRSLEEQLAEKTRELESAQVEIARLWFCRSDLREKLKAANASCSSLKRYHKELKGELTEAKKEAESLKSTVTAAKVGLGRESRKNLMLQKDIRALNQRAELLNPLVDIGVATRLRFLQHARRTIHRHRISDQDAIIVKNGNVAAHGGNGIADAAMFKAYLVTKGHVLGQIFKDLYHCEPA
jgi:nitrate/nitrite-specific signal transduction histidine kinase